MLNMTENTKGAVLMMAAMASFACSDAVVKSLLEHLPLFQAIFLRGAITTVLVLLVLSRFAGRVSLRMPPKDMFWVVVRSLCEIGASILILRALQFMPLGNVTAILQASSFVIAIAAALFFGQRLGWRRLLAITFGFIGVLFIVKPGTEGFDKSALLAIAGMLFVSLRDLSVRNLSSAATTTTVTLAATVAVTVMSAVMLLGGTWVPVTPFAFGLAAVGGGFLLAAFAFSIAAMRVGEISAVTPFRYTALVWALILGFVVFGDWPDAFALLGVAIIAGAGIYTVMREARRAKA